MLHICYILQVEYHVRMELGVLNDRYMCGLIQILNDNNCSKKLIIYDICKQLRFNQVILSMFIHVMYTAITRIY